MDSRALWMVAALATLALAGCTADEGEGNGAIKIVSMPAAATDPLVLEATMAADSYSWNMGDGRAPLDGQRIEHVYGVTDGAFTVTLTTVSGGESTTHAPLKITMGSGENTAPSLRVDVEWQWVAVGEAVTISLEGSTDADGDPILVQWLCTRKSDIGLAGVSHAHAGAGGVQYGTTNTKVIPHNFVNATGALSAGRDVGTDMCGAMNDNVFGDDTAVTGSFAERGIYELTILARDPVHFGIPATVTMYVTDEARSNGWYNETFTDKISTPLPSGADEVAAQLEQQDHIRLHEFQIEYPTKGMTATISTDGGAASSADIEYTILKGDTAKFGPTADDMDKPAGFFAPGPHRALVALRSGAEVTYELDISIQYVTDPTKLFDDPAGH